MSSLFLTHNLFLLKFLFLPYPCIIISYLLAIALLQGSGQGAHPTFGPGAMPPAVSLSDTDLSWRGGQMEFSPSQGGGQIMTGIPQPLHRETLRQVSIWQAE
jgi:hypothetical protein